MLNAETSRARNFLLDEAAAASRADQFTAGLTGIRALAALMVLAHHVFASGGPRLLAFNIGDIQITWHWLLTCSWMGANVFFVLSGFLLAIPFVNYVEGGKPVPTLPYLLRRIRRVVPAYWTQIAILVAVLAMTASLPSWQLVGAHLLFLQNFRADFNALNGVYWTLPSEFGFYLLLPAFAGFTTLAGMFGMRRRAGWLLLCVALVAAAIAWRTLMYASVADEPIGIKAFVLLQLPGLIDHFAVGMMLAWVYVRFGKLISARASNALVISGLAGIIAMMALLDHEFATYWDGHILLFLGYTIIAIFIGLLVLGTATGGPLARALFANSPMLFFGMISYSLYLWHLPVIRWTTVLLERSGITRAGDDTLFWLIAIAIPLSLLIATLSYFLIERPFMHRRKSAPA